MPRKQRKARQARAAAAAAAAEAATTEPVGETTNASALSEEGPSEFLPSNLSQDYETITNKTPSISNINQSSHAVPQATVATAWSRNRTSAGSLENPSTSNLSESMKAVHISAKADNFKERTSNIPRIDTANRPLTPGKYGRRIELETNFFRFNKLDNLNVSQLAVSIWQMRHPDEADPQKRKKCRDRYKVPDDEKIWMDISAVESITYNRNVFKVFLMEYGSTMGHQLAYDGRSIAYSPRKINPKYLDNQYSIRVSREGTCVENEKQNQDGLEEVRISMIHAKDLNFSNLVNGKIAKLASVEYLAVLDNVIAHSPMEKYIQIGRSFFSPDGAIHLGNYRDSPVSAWRGFYQSARLAQMGLVVNLDESFTTFWNHGGNELMRLIRDINNGHDLTNHPGQCKKVSLSLKHLKVRAWHTGIVYKIHGFSKHGADAIRFDDGKGQQISITDYFQANYSISLRYRNMPCVKTNPKRDTFLPIEMLTVLENQRMRGILSPTQTASMVKCASSRPRDKKFAAQKTISRLQLEKDPLCQNFGVKVETNLVKVDARILPPPQLEYNGSKKAIVKSGMWWPSGKFFLPAKLERWCVIVEDNCIAKNICDRFISTMAKSASKAGMFISQPIFFSANLGQVHSYLRVAMNRFNERNSKPRMKGDSIQLILIIKNDEDSGSYNLIKREGDINLGIATQVVLAKKLSSDRGLDKYCDNVLLKINSKLGGQNCNVSSYVGTGVPDVPFLKSPHIVLGADVTHPNPGGRTPSVAALVGSRDKEGVQYSASIRTQKSGQEVIEDIGNMFLEVYQMWRENFKYSRHAEAVIMFRDGVSEGQFREVMEREVEAIRQACSKLPSFKPLITYIIVTKRHHARFFPKNNEGDKNGNTLPGTVVDTQVTSKDFYDFYLNSHAGIQGTNRPSKYTVLVDENKISIDALQGYVYRLSHGFVRCNRSVSMVNSAYYAHLLAFRGRAYLDEEHQDNISNVSASVNEEEIQKTPEINKNLRFKLFFV